MGCVPGEMPAMAGESLANLFAYRLLVPALWFAQDASELDFDVPELKRRYRTASHEVIAWRFLDLAEPCVITIVDNDHVHRRRSNCVRVTKSLESVERECQRYVHQHGRARVVRKDRWTVFGWPIHQGEWKREILRTVVDESF
jgi:hypothetical protein